MLLLLLIVLVFILVIVGVYQIMRMAHLTVSQLFDPLRSYLGVSNSRVSNTRNSVVAPPATAQTTDTPPTAEVNKVVSLSLPIRAAFYYPWFPEAWKQSGLDPYTEYTPSLGFYSSSDPEAVSQQINAMLYANIQAGIASWWGPGSPTDQRFPGLLSAATGTDFKWAIYYEGEGQGNPDANSLSADLTYIRDHYSNDPAYLHINDRFVVFVYGSNNDGCDTLDRWQQANTARAYLVVKIFPNYQSCLNQPDSWHQYAPALAENPVGRYSFTISPGLWKAGESPQLTRDPEVWKQSIQDMVASKADFQLIISFNEWGEGSAVESAAEWATPSGYGAYLDALHDIPTDYINHSPTVTAQPGQGDPIILAAGDIAACDSPGDEETAALLKTIPATIIPLGDNAYENGTLADYKNCYDPTWGQFKSRSHPAVGNHDYLTVGAIGYYKYFGAEAGDPTKGYYSYDLGAWHVVVLNSNCADVGGCDPRSPQVAWLKADLAAHQSVLCTLAYFHQPRFSSGLHGNNTRMDTFWQVLYQAGVDVILNGHDHDYERFALQNPDGIADPINGIREFVVGTGGKNLTSITNTPANSEVLNDSTWGVLELILHPSNYEWKFLPVAGETFTDSGSTTCH